VPRASQELIARAGTILVCEDVKVIQRLFISFLHRFGFSDVVSADDGQQGMETFEKAPRGRIGLVLMDMLMPRLDGLETTRKLREIERRQRHQPLGSSASDGAPADDFGVPVICLTANDRSQAEEHLSANIRNSDRVGFATIVTKPCSMQQLYEAIVLALR
jgi:CheY-like chemotaxis protein